MMALPIDVCRVAKLLRNRRIVRDLDESLSVAGLAYAIELKTDPSPEYFRRRMYHNCLDVTRQQAPLGEQLCAMYEDAVAADERDPAEPNDLYAWAMRHALPNERPVLEGLYHDGLEQRDVAARLGIHESVVSVRKARLLERLRRLVSAWR